MLISIVVPIYNSEEYLKECIESIINQTYKNIEIIMINDGSTDNSKDICDSYAKKDNRIIVINQENLGVSEARNIGIKKAKGEYILFVDSDDIIHEKFVEILNSGCNIDCLNICKRKVFKNKIEKTIIDKYERKVLEKNKIIKLYDMGLMNSPCGKLYNKKIILENNLLFNSKVSLGEDLLFNIEYFKYIDTVKVINLNMYYYRINENTSLSKKYNENFNYIATIIFDKVEETFKDTSNKKELYTCLCAILISNIQNEFNNKNIGFLSRVKKARKSISDKKFTDRLKKCKKYIKKSDYNLLKYRCIILYKILYKIRNFI